MKILMVSYFFYPEITPRAFRTYELAKEFTRLGHEVTVYIPEHDFNYGDLKKSTGIILKEIPPGFLLERTSKPADGKDPGRFYDRKAGKKRNFLKFLKPLFGVFYNLVYVEKAAAEYFYPVYDSLKKDRGGYDLLISVGLPFSAHFGCFLALLKNKSLARVKIAEYGDPFSLSVHKWQFRYCKIYKFIEKLVLTRFDFVTVPTTDMAVLFRELKEPGRIKMIPQGFDFSGIKLAEYKKKQVPTFAYAGIFYPDIRNPDKLFEFLSNLQIDFRFHVYTDISESASMDCIKPFTKKLGEKLIVHDSIKREELNFELSKFDFLVNIRYKTDYQIPIKLIDYALAGRPVIELSQDWIDEERLVRFINGIYDSLDGNIELSYYNVKNVAPQFIELAFGKNFNCIERCDG